MALWIDNHHTLIFPPFPCIFKNKQKNNWLSLGRAVLHISLVNARKIFGFLHQSDSHPLEKSGESLVYHRDPRGQNVEETLFKIGEAYNGDFVCIQVILSLLGRT